MTLPDPADLTLPPNLGARSARVLHGVGVRTIGELRALGPVETYRRARVAGEEPSLILLWALVAGLRGEHWTGVGAQEKAALRGQLRDE